MSILGKYDSCQAGIQSGHLTSYKMHFLSYLTFITSAVASALPSPPGLAARQSNSLDKGYVFAYFTGDSKSGENIFVAASKGKDILDWQELNGGQPILASRKGTRSLRDPFLIKVRT